MFFWTNHPFLRITSVFALGIISARLGFPTPSDTFFFLCLALLCFTLTGKLLFKISSNHLLGNLLLASIFLMGGLHYKQTTHSDSNKSNLSKWAACQSYIGIISSFPNDKEKYRIYEIDLVLGLQDSSFIYSPTRLLLYERKDSTFTSKFNYGNKIHISGSPSLFKGPKNPYEFDFRKYMSDQHIQLQHFVSSDQINLLEKNQGNPLMSAVYRLRSHFEKIIKTQVSGKNEQAIVLALLLGIKGQLDSNTKAAYAAAGAMHVLAVSGLHVSIIYFMLSWLFKGLPAGNLKRFLVPTISIAALWLYALLTGFSPSILRAVSMFSIIIFAQVLSRRSQVFNSLALAAFILLLIDPFYLFNIGFQLSFLAVAGIVYIYPKIYSAWDVKNWVGDYLWKLTCVSVAAQIATFPLSLHYFNQFPSYFLLGNIIIIPTAFAVMILGISTLILSPFINWIGWLLEKLVSFMSWSVQQVERLNGSVIDWIYISEFQTLLIYLAVISFFAFLRFRKTTYVWIICFVLSILSIDRMTSVLHQYKAKQLVFYSTGKDPIIDLIQSFNTDLISPDSLSDFNNKTLHIAPYRIHHLLPKPKSPRIISSQLADIAKMEVFEGKKLLFFYKPFDNEEINFRLCSDFVIISNQSIRSLTDLEEVVDYKQVILDNSNGTYYVQNLLSEAKSMGIELYSLRDQAHLISLSRSEKFLDMLF